MNDNPVMEKVIFTEKRLIKVSDKTMCQKMCRTTLEYCPMGSTGEVTDPRYVDT